jgi:hypothetical protein
VLAVPESQPDLFQAAHEALSGHPEAKSSARSLRQLKTVEGPPADGSQ